MFEKKTLPDHFFRRFDESDDHAFYSRPRLTVHLDRGALNELTAFFLRELPFHGTILDLMSSYRSHLPASMPVEHVVGLGMNEEELQHNRQLDEYHVHNLNHDPTLPFEDASFDAVLCTVSVQYLTDPVAVFRDVARVLRPGGQFIVSFSNRCFPSKAVYVWLHTNDQQHTELVQMYFALAGGFSNVRSFDLSPARLWGDPLYVVSGQRSA